MARPLRVLYVFTARKGPLMDAVARETAPDTLLFGFNHVGAHGIEATVHEPEYGPSGQRIARAIGRLGPDVVQLRTLRRFAGSDVVFLTGGWPLLLAARVLPSARRPRLVWLNMTLTHLIRRGGPISTLVGAAARCADRIVCVAESQRQFLHRRLNIPLSRLPLVRSGTDAAFYAPERAQRRSASEDVATEQRQTVLAAGRDPGRDYATLMGAASGAPFHVRVVCSRSNLAGLSLPDAVTPLFDIPQTALRDEYATADVVVVPTKGERSTAGSDCSGTLVLLDALAMGRPVVITERDSVRDYVTPGEHALTVPAEDAGALRRAIESQLQDGERAGAMARAGRAHVLDQLTTAHFARDLAAVLHEVAR